jgi:AcrR family transcriptional regulator
MAITTIAPVETRVRILDAAFQAVSRHGLSRFTMDDVARAAALSRQSVYRYFASKDDLVLALVEREEESFIDGVRAEFETHGNLEEAMAAAIAFCLRAAREHPLLDRLLETEPEVLLPYLTTRGAPIIERARAALEQIARDRPDIRPDLVRRTADLTARAIVSYTLTPSEDPPEAVARESARVLTAAVREGRKERP